MPVHFSQLALDVYGTLVRHRGPNQDVYLVDRTQRMYVRETPAWFVVPVADELDRLGTDEVQVWAMADGESPVGLWVVIEAAAEILNSHGFVTAVMGPALTVARAPQEELVRVPVWRNPVIGQAAGEAP